MCPTAAPACGDLTARQDAVRPPPTPHQPDLLVAMADLTARPLQDADTAQATAFLRGAAEAIKD